MSRGTMKDTAIFVFRQINKVDRLLLFGLGSIRRIFAPGKEVKAWRGWREMGEGLETEEVQKT